MINAEGWYANPSHIADAHPPARESESPEEGTDGGQPETVRVSDIPGSVGLKLRPGCLPKVTVSAIVDDLTAEEAMP